MYIRLKKVLVFILCFCFISEQLVFAQTAAIDISSNLPRSVDSSLQRFTPTHLRSVEYDVSSRQLQFKLDKGSLGQDAIDDRVLKHYFLIGISLPNSTFWVNLRPDSPEEMLDPAMAKTELGRVLLEADLQLKKDAAGFTAPNTASGREYWNKLYKKAEELYGNSNADIPTLIRPWIVPDEILLRESEGKVYIYKARLKVMLESDYLKDQKTYGFTDARQKKLNEFSSGLVRELIIPRITKEINTSRKYASLRQAYYSLILAQWFKKRFRGMAGEYPSRIDSGDLSTIESKSSWSRMEYFSAYQKSFKDGEYKLSESARGASGAVVRTYFSGGGVLAVEMPALSGPRAIAGNVTIVAGRKGIGGESEPSNIASQKDGGADDAVSEAARVVKLLFPAVTADEIGNVKFQQVLMIISRDPAQFSDSITALKGFIGRDGVEEYFRNDCLWLAKNAYGLAKNLESVQKKFSRLVSGISRNEEAGRWLTTMQVSLKELKLVEGQYQAFVKAVRDMTEIYVEDAADRNEVVNRLDLLSEKAESAIRAYSESINRGLSIRICQQRAQEVRDAMIGVDSFTDYVVVGEIMTLAGFYRHIHQKLMTDYLVRNAPVFDSKVKDKVRFMAAPSIYNLSGTKELPSGLMALLDSMRKARYVYEGEDLARDMRPTMVVGENGITLASIPLGKHRFDCVFRSSPEQAETNFIRLSWHDMEKPGIYPGANKARITFIGKVLERLGLKVSIDGLTLSAHYYVPGGDRIAAERSSERINSALSRIGLLNSISIKLDLRLDVLFMGADTWLNAQVSNGWVRTPEEKMISFTVETMVERFFAGEFLGPRVKKLTKPFYKMNYTIPDEYFDRIGWYEDGRRELAEAIEHETTLFKRMSTPCMELQKHVWQTLSIHEIYQEDKTVWAQLSELWADKPMKLVLREWIQSGKMPAGLSSGQLELFKTLITPPEEKQQLDGGAAASPILNQLFPEKVVNWLSVSDSSNFSKAVEVINRDPEGFADNVKALKGYIGPHAVERYFLEDFYWLALNAGKLADNLRSVKERFSSLIDGIKRNEEAGRFMTDIQRQLHELGPVEHEYASFINAVGAMTGIYADGAVDRDEIIGRLGILAANAENAIKDYNESAGKGLSLRVRQAYARRVKEALIGTDSFKDFAAVGEIATLAGFYRYIHKKLMTEYLTRGAIQLPEQEMESSGRQSDPVMYNLSGQDTLPAGLAALQDSFHNARHAFEGVRVDRATFVVGDNGITLVSMPLGEHRFDCVFRGSNDHAEENFIRLSWQDVEKPHLFPGASMARINFVGAVLERLGLTVAIDGLTLTGYYYVPGGDAIAAERSGALINNALARVGSMNAISFLLDLKIHTLLFKDTWWLRGKPRSADGVMADDNTMKYIVDALVERFFAGEYLSGTAKFVDNVITDDSFNKIGWYEAGRRRLAYEISMRPQSDGRLSGLDLQKMVWNQLHMNEVYREDRTVWAQLSEVWAAEPMKSRLRDWITAGKTPDGLSPTETAEFQTLIVAPADIVIQRDGGLESRVREKLSGHGIPSHQHEAIIRAIGEEDLLKGSWPSWIPSLAKYGLDEFLDGFTRLKSIFPGISIADVLASNPPEFGKFLNKIENMSAFADSVRDLRGIIGSEMVDAYFREDCVWLASNAGRLVENLRLLDDKFSSLLKGIGHNEEAGKRLTEAQRLIGELRAFESEYQAFVTEVRAMADIYADGAVNPNEISRKFLQLREKAEIAMRVYNDSLNNGLSARVRQESAARVREALIGLDSFKDPATVGEVETLAGFYRYIHQKLMTEYLTRGAPSFEPQIEDLAKFFPAYNLYNLSGSDVLPSGLNILLDAFHKTRYMYETNDFAIYRPTIVVGKNGIVLLSMPLGRHRLDCVFRSSPDRPQENFIKVAWQDTEKDTISPAASRARVVFMGKVLERLNLNVSVSRSIYRLGVSAHYYVPGGDGVAAERSVDRINSALGQIGLLNSVSSLLDMRINVLVLGITTPTEARKLRDMIRPDEQMMNYVVNVMVDKFFAGQYLGYPRGKLTKPFYKTNYIIPDEYFEWIGWYAEGRYVLAEKMSKEWSKAAPRLPFELQKEVWLYLNMSKIYNEDKTVWAQLSEVWAAQPMKRWLHEWIKTGKMAAEITSAQAVVFKTLITPSPDLLAQKDGGGMARPGGIDFRDLPVRVADVDLKALFGDLPRGVVEMDVNAEWARIQKMVNRGILPSCGRVKEYVGSCYLKGMLPARARELLLFFTDMLKAEEAAGRPTDTAIPDMLVVLESV